MDKILPLFDIVMITVAEESKRGKLDKDKMNALQHLCERADEYIDLHGSTEFGVEYDDKRGSIKIVLKNDDSSSIEFSLDGLWEVSNMED